MSPTLSRRCRQAMVLATLAVSGYAHAGTNGTWTYLNPSGLSWGTASNWAGNQIADGADGIVDFSTLDITASSSIYLDTARTIGTLKFGDISASHDWTLDGPNTLTLDVGTGTPTINVVNRTATINTVLAGTKGLMKTGAGMLVLTAANSYSGNTVISVGTLKLDFSAAGAPASDIINSLSPLRLGGGTLQILGASSGSAQTFANTQFAGSTGGQTVISAAPVSGGTNPAVNFGALTGSQGAMVRFDGPAYNSGPSSGTTLGGTPVGATTTMTATTTTVGTGGIISITTAVTGYSSFATVGLYDWAAISTSISNTIVGLSQNNAGYTVGATLPPGFQAGNWDLTGNVTFANNNNTSSAYGTFRFNTPGALTLTTCRAQSANVVGGLLVTPNVGAANITIAPGSHNSLQASRSSNGPTGITIWQNNTLGALLINANYINGSSSAANANYVQGGLGAVFLNGANNYTGQTYLNGGVTVINANARIGAEATGAAVNLNGGALFANATFALDNVGANSRAVTFNGSGGTLAASTGNTLTVTGVVSGAGGLTVGMATVPGTGPGTANATAIVGNGNVLLTGANTYTGTTNVKSGVLSFSTSTQNLSSSDFTIDDGAGLSVKAASNATLLNTKSLAVGSSTGGSIVFDFSGLNVTSPLINTTGALTLNGSLGVTLLNSGALAVGTHPLVDYTSFVGSGTLPTTTFALGSRTTGTIAKDITNTVLNLEVAGDTPKWTGLDSADWRVGTTGANGNWKLISGNTPTDYLAGDTVLFDDSASVTSINLADNVSPVSVTVNNSSQAYTFSSTSGFGIGGTGTTLTKNGSNTLNIITNNTYTGGTYINAGTIVVGSGGTTGSIGTGAVVNAGTLVVNRSDSVTIGTISGSGALTHAGSGYLIINTPNFASSSVIGGALTVNSGTFQFNTGANANTTGDFTAAGLTGSGTVINGGGVERWLLVNTPDLTTHTFNGVLTNGEAAALGLRKLGAGTQVLSQANTHTGPTTIDGGVVRVDHANAAQNSTVAVNVANGLGFGSGITTPTIGGLSGSGNLTLGNVDSAAIILAVGNNNANTSYSGVLSGPGSLKKIGTGILTLTNTGNTTAMNISAGTLVAGQNSSFSNGGLGTGDLVLTGGAAISSSFAAGNTWTFGNELDIPAGQSGFLYTPNRFRWSGAVTGDGDLTVNVTTDSGTSRMDFSNDLAAFTGRLTLQGTPTGQVRLYNNGGNFNVSSFASTELFVEGTVRVRAVANTGGNTYPIGALGGSSSTAGFDGSDNGTSTYSIGALNTDTTFAGYFASNLNLTKTGNKTLTLTGNNTHTGVTTVSAGTLRVNGTHTGGGNYVVNANATLGGTGQITLASGKSLTVNALGKLAPGASIGVLTIDAPTVTLAADSNLVIEVDNSGGIISAADQLVIGSSAASIDINGAELSFDFVSPTMGAVTHTTPVVIVNNQSSADITTDFKDIPRGENGSFAKLTGVLKYTLYYTYNASNGQTTGGNDIAIQFSAVPEPSAGFLLAGAMLGCRRKRSAAH